MARKDNLDFVDQAVESANLQEKASAPKDKKKKVKTIQILVDWENRIKEYHGGTVTSYITMAIQEKMRKDGIL
ncbi:MAG TPA: hypothetical protein ENK98_06650 [Epsilonproteobacteria bacterium]|nr:hypothetical protein [Campylobacterota bacterium]